VAQPKEQQAELPTLVRTATPVTVTIRPNGPSHKKIQGLLGSQCDLRQLSAVVLQQTASNVFVLGVPASKKCNAAELTVGGRDAVVSIPPASASAGG
jgi:hypothetical protein